MINSGRFCVGADVEVIRPSKNNLSRESAVDATTFHQAGHIRRRFQPFKVCYTRTAYQRTSANGTASTDDIGTSLPAIACS